MNDNDTARFWNKVDRPDNDNDSCWVWQASTVQGYGQFWLNGKMTKAHRIAYQLEIGPITEGLVLDHLCRNRACVNPKHHDPVTNTINVLRGHGITAQAARKTHCLNGHPLTPDNLYSSPSRPDKRACRTCNRNRKRQTRKRSTT